MSGLLQFLLFSNFLIFICGRYFFCLHSFEAPLTLVFLKKVTHIFSFSFSFVASTFFLGFPGFFISCC
jgi:hypothetical protein